MSGYCATGKVASEMLPASTMTMDSTEAKIGRLMKNFENTVYVSFRLHFLPAPTRGEGRTFLGSAAMLFFRKNICYLRIAIEADLDPVDGGRLRLRGTISLPKERQEPGQAEGRDAHAYHHHLAGSTH